MSDEIIACVCTRASDLIMLRLSGDIISIPVSVTPSDLTSSPHSSLPLLTIKYVLLL